MASVVSFRSRLLSASGLASVLSFVAIAAQAGGLPHGGHFVDGHGTLNKANQSLTVKQSSTTGIIDWNSFSIGRKNGVGFDNGSGATLNRVTGGNLSRIAGSLHATGSLYLMNGAGVIVSGSGHIVTGGSFVASSGAISNEAIENDKLGLRNGKAAVVNRGTIVSSGGVSLLAGNVRDSGTISASSVDLNAARHLTIGGTIAAQNADGSGGALIARAHTIVIDASGRVDASATGAGKAGGTVSIVARNSTTVAGSIAADGGSHGTGGFIETSGKQLHVADSARISTLATDGKTGTWLVDPQDFTIAASGGDITGAALSGELASNDITIKSSEGAKAGNGDIFVDDAVTWSSNSTLTLDAFRNIEIAAPITVSGAGGLVLVDADTTGTGVNDGTPSNGDYFFDGGNISFTGGSGSGATLSINAQAYTLLYSMSDVQAINANDTTLQGDYALATSLDASSTTGWIPIGTDGAGDVGNFGNGFSGIFDGLGNTISNLAIDIGSNSDAGPFGVSSGTIRDIGLIGGSVSGNDYVGGLVGINTGMIGDSYATGSVNGSGQEVGGLVGYNEGTIGDSYATGAVSGTFAVGGLVGENDAMIGDSYATGAVNGLDDDIGGLVGLNHGTISDSYATGSVSGSVYIGGLVGFNDDTIGDSYATGAVSGSSDVGGFVGEDDSTGGITQSYWDTQTSGITDTTAGAGNKTNDSGITGMTTAQLTAALPGGFDPAVWGNVANQTTPYLLALTSNPQTVYVGDGSEGAFSLLFTMAQVQAINSSNTTLSENYALANSLDATGISGWVPLGTDGAGNIGNSGNGFSGIFDGLGNTISNLTVNIGANNYAGLFGYSTGTIRGIGLVGGSVGGRFDVGGLVGYNIGTIGDSYATGLVSGRDGVGGLAGINYGTIGDSYATGAVSGSAFDVGGLVGINDGTIGGSYATGAVNGSDDDIGGLVGLNIATISDSYATGAVGGSSDVGGLVGENDAGTIGDSYATGAVSGSSDVGGFVGEDGSTGGITQSYWDTQTSGITDTTAGAGNVSNDSGITGKTTAQLTAALPSGFDPAVWGNVANQTTPYLLALTSNPQTVYVGDGSEGAFSLLFTMAQVQAINTSDTALQGNYALANSLDASSTTGWVPIGTDGASHIGNSNNGFSGIFDGLGNTISNLTVNTGTNDYVGPFGYSSGTIRNIGLIGGSVNGGAYVGGLVGYNIGTIGDSYATGAVSAGNYVGGLVGDDDGTIGDSYATGAVSGNAYVGGLAGYSGGTISDSYATGSVSGVTFVGGLVGYNYTGAISDSYATGSVSGSVYIGGLVGFNDDTIGDSYATGAVSGSSDVGGFVGEDDSTGGITQSYWDTQTSGITDTTAGAGNKTNDSGITGMTTAQLTAALPGGFDPAVWGNVANQTTPYLLALTSNPQTVYVGDGSEGAFSLLFTMAQVQAINSSNTTLSENYALANSLDASSTTGWVPIGTDGAGHLLNSNQGFTGIFDGLGNTISNLTVSSLDSAIGLFGDSSGTIRDIGIVDGAFTGISDVGALAGINNGTVTNAYSTGTVTGFDAVGGLIGDSGGDVTNSHSSSLVTGEIVPGSSSSGNPGPLGGLIGQVDAGTVSDSYATGDVTAADGDTMGGLIGQTNVGVTVSNTYATGNVSATSIVNGGAEIGGLIGSSFDAVSDSYATGNVAGEQFVGGLIGEATNNSVISRSYATGSVTGDASSIDLGGLVGYDGGLSETDVYATGAVTGGDELGGLVGTNQSDISNAYATGFVGPASGASPTEMGALAGENDGSIDNAYWDSRTSGQSGAIGVDSGISNTTSRTTAQLQSGLPSGFSNAVWGTGAGLYPYFLWQYPSGTPQAVSGFAYTDHGVTGLGAGSVSLLIGGTAMGTASTGANGYYYFLEAPGTISGSQILTYLAGTGGAAFADNTTGSVSGLDIDNNYLNETTAGSSYATVVGDLATAIGGHSAVQTIVSGLSNLGIDYTGNATFAIDSAISLGSGTLAIEADGSVNQSASIGASNLLLLGSANYTLDNAGNAIATVAGDTTGSLDLVSDRTLTVGSVAGTDGLYVGGGAGLTTTSGRILIKQLLTADAHPLTLTSAGAISEEGSGAIDAASLTGTSAGPVALDGDNVIIDLGAFTSGGTFALSDDRSLMLDGTLDAGSHAVSLTTTGSGHGIAIDAEIKGATVNLISAAGIDESTTTGEIDAKYLSGSSDGAVSLNGANVVSDLRGFDTSGHHAFSLTDARSLRVHQTVDAGTAKLSLTTTGHGSNLYIQGALRGGTVALNSAGLIHEYLNRGVIDATTLTGSSHWRANLHGTGNSVARLDGFVAGGRRFFQFTDDRNLTIDGTIDAGENVASLVTDGSDNNITIDGAIIAGTVDLTASGAVSESGSGAITTHRLNVVAQIGIKLTSLNNDIAVLGTDTTISGPNKIKGVQ